MYASTHASFQFLLPIDIDWKNSTEIPYSFFQHWYLDSEMILGHKVPFSMVVLERLLDRKQLAGLLSWHYKKAENRESMLWFLSSKLVSAILSGCCVQNSPFGRRVESAEKGQGWSYIIRTIEDALSCLAAGQFYEVDIAIICTFYQWGNERIENL